LMLLVLEKSQRQQLLQELGVAWLDIPLWSMSVGCEVVFRCRSYSGDAFLPTYDSLLYPLYPNPNVMLTSCPTLYLFCMMLIVASGHMPLIKVVSSHVNLLFTAGDTYVATCMRKWLLAAVRFTMGHSRYIDSFQSYPLTHWVWYHSLQ
jgi:hypothetical protein